MAKEPIKLRKKPLANGGYSLYLDIYKNGKRSFEFLKLYLNPGNDPATKAKNNSAMEAAKIIQAKRIMEAQYGAAGIETKKDLTMDGLLEIVLKEKTHITEERKKVYRNAARLFNRFAPGMKIADITDDTMRDFITYLETTETLDWQKRAEEAARKNRNAPRNRYRTSSTVKVYYSLISTMLGRAVKRGYIASNPAAMLDSSEKPKFREHIREYLTLEEVGKLMNTPHKNSLITSMFLFGCFTGLRLSDVMRVTWKDIDRGTIGMKMQKTSSAVYVPLSENARKVLPERGKAKSDDLVFPLTLTKGAVNSALQRWVAKAGIDKHITFHCSRHTFATLLLYYGTDLYTVSKLLGHTDIKVTQIYAKVMDQRKVEAVNSIPTI